MVREEWCMVPSMVWRMVCCLRAFRGFFCASLSDFPPKAVSTM